jgi:hypothetical protein
MTPLVSEMAAIGGDISTEFHWFDLSVVKSEIDDDEPLLRTPLPYDKVALCGLDADGNKFLLYATQVNHNPQLRAFAIFGYVLQRSAFQKIPMLRVIVDGDSIECVDADTEQKKTTAIVSCAILTDFLGRLRQSSQNALVPTQRGNHAKRARQGKPLIFDWHTIEIAPSKPKNESLGGTHASPRQHDRRGHWRNVGTNLVWVRSCVVGDSAKGSVFKDYLVLPHDEQHEGSQQEPRTPRERQ